MRKRPSPVRWLWYAAGGRLSDAHREWVLHDVTARTWPVRHAARSTVLVGPLAAVWWLVPAPPALQAALTLMACLVGYFYSFAYAVESAEHRLAKHGFPRGTFARMRRQARRGDAEAAEARYIARYRSGHSS